MTIEIGQIVEGKVSGITKFGAFVDLADGQTGLVHISEVANNFVNDINEHLAVGQEVKVKVLSLDEKGKISLSIKKAQEAQRKPKYEPPQFNGRPAEIDWNDNAQENMSFEDMMANFKQSSDAKMLDLKRNVEAKRGTRRK